MKWKKSKLNKMCPTTCLGRDGERWGWVGRNGEGWRGMGRGEEGCGRMERDGKKSISDPKGWREQF